MKLSNEDRMKKDCNMNLEEYSQKIIRSTKHDWNVITCWGFGSGPSYLDRSTVWTTGKNEFSNIEVESQGMVASLKSDLSISMAWGIGSNPDFQEDWANQFPDPDARSYFIDFFYNGVLVFRDIYVSVDGGRCHLPLPDIEFDEKTHKVKRYTVPQDKYEFYEMFDGLEQLSDFDSYFSRAGFEVVDVPWMV